MKTKVTKIQVDQMLEVLLKLKNQGVEFVNFQIEIDDEMGDKLDIYPYRKPQESPLTFEEVLKKIAYGKE